MRQLLCTIRLLTCLLFLAITNCRCLASDSPIVAIAFAPSGTELAVASQAGVRVVNWPGLETQEVLQTRCDNPHALAFSPTGDQLAIVGGAPADSGQLEIISWNSRDSIALIEAGDDALMDVVWLDNQQLAMACLDFNCYLVNLTLQSSLAKLDGHSRGITSLCIIPSKKMLVTAGIDQSLRAWNLESNTLVRSMSIHSRPVRNIATRPGSEGLPMVASVSTDRTVRFWQPTIGRMVRFAKLPAIPLDVAWTNDGKYAAVACEDGKLRMVNATTVSIEQEFAAINGWVYAIAVHPSDGSFAVGGEDNQLIRISAKPD